MLLVLEIVGILEIKLVLVLQNVCIAVGSIPA